MNRQVSFLSLLMALTLSALAQNITPRDSLTVSIVTCAPGSEIFELYGHEAIWVQSDEIDEVYNYGLFNFSDPGFIYRFVKGETDYMSGCEPMSWFIPQYIQRGSQVVARPLNLTQEEAHRLHSILHRNASPENATYRYKYLSNNCATRILDDIDEAIGQPVIYPVSNDKSSFRHQMRYYNRNYPWYQFGIDLALGGDIDRPMSSRERMFVPMELDNIFASATRPDGSRLAGDAQILYEGRGDVTLPPTSFLLSPSFVSWLLFVIIVVLTIHDLRRHRTTKWPIALWFMVCGLAGCLIWFLVFCSVHEGASHNLLAWWLNPLCLAVPVMIYVKCAHKLLACLLTANVIIVGVLLLTSPWVQQSYNAAFYPLMLVSMTLSAGYTINYYRNQFKNR